MRTKNKEARRELESYYTEIPESAFEDALSDTLGLLKNSNDESPELRLLARYVSVRLVDLTIRRSFSEIFGGFNREYE